MTDRRRREQQVPKRVFTAGERYGIWDAHESKCSWCVEPVVFKLVEIDHIIPESLEGDPDELNSVKIKLGLDEKFQINDYCNWVPICARCNKSKSNKVFTPTPMYLGVLQTAAAKAEKAKRIAQRFTADKKYGAQIEALVESGRNAGDFSKEFWEKTKEAGDKFYKDEPRPAQPLDIPLTKEVSLTLTQHGIELVKRWMSVRARTVMPSPHEYYVKIKARMKNIAASKDIKLLGNLVIDANTLFNAGLINQEQMTFLVRAVHAIEPCLDKAELTDPELFSAQSTAIQALNALSSIPESGVKD